LNYVKMRVASHYICHMYVKAMYALQTQQEFEDTSVGFWKETGYMIKGIFTVMRNKDVPRKRNYIIGHGDYWWMDVYTNFWRRQDHDTYSWSSGYPLIFAFLFFCETVIYVFITGWFYFGADTSGAADNTVKQGTTAVVGGVLFIWWLYRLFTIVKRFYTKEPKSIDPEKPTKGEKMMNFEESHCSCCPFVPHGVSVTKLASHSFLFVLVIGGLACAFVTKWQFGMYFLINLVLAVELYVWDCRHLSTTTFPGVDTNENTLDWLQGYNVKDKQLITPKTRNFAFRLLARDLFAFNKARKNIIKLTAGFSILGFLLFVALGLTNSAVTQPIQGTVGAPIAAYPAPGETITYMCERTAAPGQDDYGLTLLDFAYFSMLSYYEPLAVDSVLKVWFGDDWSQVVPQDDVDQRNSASFYDFYNSRLNISVVSTRGTFNMYDWVQDAAIWMEAVIFQLYEYFFFLGSIYENVFWALIRGLNAIFLLELPTIESQTSFYGRAVYEYTVSTLPQRREVIMSGHSLGGGIAQIVGAALNLRAFGMSGPGVKYSRGKYDLQLDILTDKLVNVQPQLDIVPMFDKQALRVQHILCDLGMFACHSIQNTLCEIQRICGDPRGRRFDLDPPFQCRVSSTLPQ